ncbi:MAG: DegV family protein [Eubacteriales bacterium]
MKNYTLNGYAVYDYIISGAKKIIQNEKQLNEINVFPVADGDTGSNLAFTMNHIIRNAKKSEDVSVTLDSISAAAVDASFGNSGTIFAKYLYGLSLENKDKKNISVKEFINGLHRAVNYAYDSISMPKEGTILTVMKEWTGYLNKNEHKHNEFENLLESSIDYSYNVLDNTKNLLDVLKEADVVDAGAKGFVCFVEGILDHVRFGKGKKNIISRIEQVDFDKIDHLSGKMEFNFCSEFTIENLKIKRKELIKTLNKYGDSAIVNIYKNKAKIHLHTNEPQKVMLKLIKLGRVVESKVDDMSIQYDIVHKKRKKIGLITDSIADIPKKLVKNNMITVIPIQLLSEGTVYLDRITVDGETVYEILDNVENYPTSSQPSETNIERTFEFLLNYYEEIVGVFVSDKMSGTFSKITKVVEKLEEKDKILLVNSKLNSGGEGLVVKKAAEYIQEGLTLENIKEKLEEDVKKTKIYVKIPDLNYAVRSGRVPKVVGSFASLVGLQPIISIDQEGKGSVTGKRNLAKIVQKENEKKGIVEYSIIHTKSLKNAEKLAEDLEKIIGNPPLYIENVSAVVSAFIGKGAYGVAFKEA